MFRHAPAKIDDQQPPGRPETGLLFPRYAQRPCSNLPTRVRMPSSTQRLQMQTEHYIAKGYLFF